MSKVNMRAIKREIQKLGFSQVSRGTYIQDGESLQRDVNALSEGFESTKYSDKAFWVFTNDGQEWSFDSLEDAAEFAHN